MRRPPRRPFHHSDLGGAFLAFAPRFGEDDEDVARRPLAEDSAPATRQRPSMFTRLIDALREWRGKAELPNQKDE